MKQPKYEVLEKVPLPEVAAALRSRADAIVGKWRKAVIKILPQADELTRKQLENSIPQLLQELADALAADNAAPTQKLSDDAPTHGETRFHQNFNLNELLIEYHVLRAVLLEEVSAALDRGLTSDEVIGLNSGIDITLREAAVEFSHYQSDQIQAETNRMSKYLSFLSHDLRGSLNGAVLTIEVLKRELMSEPRFAESLQDVDAVRRSIFDTVATMDRFLHAEQLRRGKLAVTKRPVNLTELLEHVIRNKHYLIQERGTKVTSEVQTPVTPNSDPEALTIILANLLSNAIKYGGGKPVKFLATTNEGGVRISVIDQGPGIASDKLKTLFQPFTRGDTHGQKGVGLGLSIAKQTAELLGAKLTVDSKPGQGSSFHLDLPA